jgi:hypothetical protein
MYVLSQTPGEPNMGFILAEINGKFRKKSHSSMETPSSHLKQSKHPHCPECSEKSYS